MKKTVGFFLISVVGLFVIISIAVAGSQPPPEGGVLPDFDLSVPESAEHQAYLGLAGKNSFQIPQIKAEVVIIEIFSMY